jgi:hypothetical protein
MKSRFAAGLALAVLLRAPIAAAIVNGTIDTGDSAVVAVLVSDGQGGYGACSGTVVSVANGLASVITAGTCCSPLLPTIVVTGNDYSVGEAYVANPSAAVAPAYPVIASSVKIDTKFNANSGSAADDFCMLRFAAPSALAALPVALGADNLSPGVSVRYVGFGVTRSGDQTSSQRRTVVTTLSSLDANTLGTTGSNTTCGGDVGGAVLAGSPLTLVGVIAFGDPACSQFTQSARATSETGSGGFISSYLMSGGVAPPVPAGASWSLALLVGALVATGVGAMRLRSRA